MTTIFRKQPAEVLDYDVDFTSWLGTSDIINSAVAASDAGITRGATEITAGGKIVKQWISGGSSNTSYKVTVTATTSAGRVKEAEFIVKVREL